MTSPRFGFANNMISVNGTIRKPNISYQTLMGKGILRALRPKLKTEEIW